MPRLQATVTYIAQVAGWSAPQADTKGQYFFALDGGLSVTLMSPDGMTCIMKSTIMTLPQDTREADAILSVCARRALGRARTCQSIVSVEGNLVLLSDTMRFEQTDKETIALRLRDFLNNLSWWKDMMAPHKASQTVGVEQNNTQSGLPKGMFVPGAGWVTL